MSSGDRATASPDVQTMRRHLHTLSDDGRLTLLDARRLQRSLDRLQGLRDPRARDRQIQRLDADFSAAERRLESRAAGVPKKISYPPELPVSQRREDLLEVIRDNQVVIVAGETGSGKTTQLPKICLELGRGVRGMIGHTQPRRLAARTVAERVAEVMITLRSGRRGSSWRR